MIEPSPCLLISIFVIWAGKFIPNFIFILFTLKILQSAIITPSQLTSLKNEFLKSDLIINAHDKSDLETLFSLNLISWNSILVNRESLKMVLLILQVKNSVLYKSQLRKMQSII